MAVSPATPSRKRTRKLAVRFVSDDEVTDFIKPLKDCITSLQATPRSIRRRLGPSSRDSTPLEKQNDQPATPRSSRRRLRPSLRDSSKDALDEEAILQDYVSDLPSQMKLATGFDEEIEHLVSGKQIYGFRTPKKEGQMTKLASDSIKALTPKSIDIENASDKIRVTPISKNKSANKNNTSHVDKINVTPKSKKLESYKVELDFENSKTPYNLRMKIKKRIVNMIEEKSDFSSSESEYMPSDKDESSEEEENGEEENEVVQNFKSSLQLIRTPKRKEQKYVYSAEDYFNSRKTSKAQTSNHTLSRLKTPKLSHSMLKDILQKMKSHHEKQIKRLNMDYHKYFGKWLFCMRQGYNILLYGLGSKRNTLNTFRQQLLSESKVVVVNGFFPSLSMKTMLHCITDDIMELKSNPTSHLECVDVIGSAFDGSSGEELFLIIHNIDGLMLRNDQSQTILSRLASVKNVHVIASVDHINSPLLWDPLKLSLFNFLWFDITTMLPYIEETSFENSAMVKQSGALALSSLKSVFTSLTTNAKGVFLIIVKYQLEHKGNSSYSGISFRDLYWKSREAFLLSSDLALRAQLTEFLDHHMVKSRMSADGDERLTIPIDNSILQDFLDEQEAA